MTITMAELKAKIRADTPGCETKPNKPPFGAVISRLCIQCNGTGWKQSAKTGRWFICPCSIEKHKNAW